MKTLALLLLAPICVIAAPSCDVRNGEDFSKFYEQVKSDKEFELSRIIFPLKDLSWLVTFNDKGEEILVPDITEELQIDYIESHINQQPLNALLKEASIVEHITKTSESSYEVSYGVNGTDLLNVNHYKLVGGCWYLWQVENRSL